MRRYLKRYLRAAAGERGRVFLRRAKHRMGLVPRVNKAAAHSLRFPGGHKAVVVISADLELAWAWRYARRVSDPLAFARQRARQGRRNLDRVLDLCDEYELAVTWATVGHLFLERCAVSNGRLHPELPRVPHFVNDLWAYREGDWFDADPGSASASDPEWADWHGPDLIRAILTRRVEHEIGSHTFSHVTLADKHCSPDVAAAELRCCRELAEGWGLRLRSLVFPGDLVGNYASVREAGFVAYRAPGRYQVDNPQRDDAGLWRIPATSCLDNPYTSWKSAEHFALLRGYVDAAVEHGLVCGLWFHPETDPRDVDEVFPRIFEYIASRRPDVWVTTMGELAGWLESELSPNGR